MCLDTVDKEIKVKEGIGWKVFDADDSHHLVSIWSGARVSCVGKWITDSLGDDIRMDWGRGYYPKGFHLYPEKPPSMYSWIRARPVEFRNVVATGTQGYHDGKRQVIVAREIRIFTAKEAR